VVNKASAILITGWILAPGLVVADSEEEAYNKFTESYTKSSFNYIGVRGGFTSFYSDEIRARLNRRFTHFHDGYSHSHGESDNSDYLYSFAAGRKFAGSNFRIELEYVINPGLDYINLDKVDVKTKSKRLMFNVNYDFLKGTNLVLSLNAGVGSATNEVISGSEVLINDARREFVYALGAGFTYKVRPNVGIELGLRYVDLGDSKFTYSDTNFTVKDALKATELFLGVGLVF